MESERRAISPGNANSKQLSNLLDLESEVLQARNEELKDRVRSQPFLFRAFGINIASDIFLPEFETAWGVPDVQIVLGETPQEIPEALVKGFSYQAAPNQFLLYVKQVGHYYVAGGTRIVVEPDHSADAGMVKLFLLGTVFGALLLQRGVLPIHGSAFVIKGQAVIITGVSGAGKSTLLAALRERGAAFLTDDVAAITGYEGNVPWVQPGYPQQKLWKDSADNIGMDVSGLTTILPGTDKYAIAAEKGFFRRPVRLAAICELRAEDRPEAAIIRLSGPAKIAVLLGHTYRQSLVAGLGLKAEHFERCVAVAKQISVCRLLRPSEKFSLEEQVQLVEGLMTELVFRSISMT